MSKKKKNQLHPLVCRSAGLLASVLLNRWLDTLDCKVAYYDPHVDPASHYCNGSKIYIFWHEYLLVPICFRGHCNVSILVSQHRDAEILADTASFWGYNIIRGSSTRGGVIAIRKMLRKNSETNLATTPDGPRGPRRQLAPGVVFLASKLGIPMIPLGLGYDRPWRLNSWDRFALPRPFSRARVVMGNEIHVPPRLGRDGLEHFRLRTEQLLTRLTVEAEAWASADTRKVGERQFKRQPASLLRLSE